MHPEVSHDTLKQIVESILFVADRPVDLAMLARICGRKQEEMVSVLDELADDCRDRGVRIQRSGAAVQMVTAPETSPYVQAFLGIDENQKLTPSALAALTVIAYRQPVSRPALEKILGKSCEWVLASLKARDLVGEVGRAGGPGRPYLYGTTFRFLEHFGLEKPEDLPPLPELEVAEQMVEDEAPADREGSPGDEDGELRDSAPNPQ